MGCFGTLTPRRNIIQTNQIIKNLFILKEKLFSKTIMFEGPCLKKTIQSLQYCLCFLKNLAPNTPLTTHLFGLLRGRTSWCSGRGQRTCRPEGAAAGFLAGAVRTSAAVLNLGTNLVEIHQLFIPCCLEPVEVVDFQNGCFTLQTLFKACQQWLKYNNISYHPCMVYLPTWIP